MTSTFAMIILTGILLLMQTIQGNSTDTKNGMVLDLMGSLSKSHVPKDPLGSAPCETVNPTIVSFIDCKRLIDGAYQDPNTRNCSEYFRCEKQQRINCSCGPELIFDAELQTCVSGNQKVPCPKTSEFNFCFNEADGFHHVPNTNCRKYYECQDGKRSYYECYDGFAFDIEKSSCVDEGEVKCSEALQSDMPTTDCAGKTDGKYGLENSHNKRFYACSSGFKIFEGACLEGQTFSEELQRCAVPSDEAHNMSKTLPLSDDDDCKGLADGYYPNIDHDCRRFFFCRDQQKLLEMACPTGMQFDDETEHCLDSSEVTCFGSQKPADESDMTEDCKNKTEGYYPLVSSECRQFIYCRNGQKTSDLYCPAGEAFDSSLGQCENENDVACDGRLLSETGDGEEDEDCFGKSDDYYPNYETDCRHFVYCKNGRKRIELVCRHNKAFDPVTKSCQPFSSVACHDESRSVTVLCSEKPDGYHPDIAKNCKSFYFCRAGRVTTQLTCGQGQAFDDDAKECIPQSQASCITSPPKRPSVSHHPKPSENVCHNQTDGFYPDYASGCSKYFHCRRGRKATEYVCTTGQLFDPVTLQCLNERYVVCSDLSLRNYLDSCTFKEDGYYPTYSKNCKTYYYCRNRLKIVDLNCRAGQIFDTNNGVCLDEAVAICANDIQQNSSIECRGRSDGYYIDYSGNCSSYFYCFQSTKAGNFTCTNGTCFDENDGVCVTFSSVGFNCSDMPDGYYIDYLSSCRKFHICQNHKLETQKCPGNMIFDLNDLSCQSRKTLQCKASRDFPCLNLPDGVYEDENGNNQLFHICRDRRHVESGSCPHYFTFNKKMTACISISTKPSEIPLAKDDPDSGFVYDCRNHDDGSYPDFASGCARFYVCTDRRLITSSECPPGQLFERWKQACHPQDQVSCEVETTIPSASKTSSFHFQFNNGCNNITLCFESKHNFMRHCHDTALMSSRHGRSYCKIGSIAEAKSEDKNGGLELQDRSSAFDCNGKEDGYYTDPPSKCRKWHMCEGSRGYTYECESGKAFNILYKRCDLAETVSCDAQSWVYRNYSTARSLPSSFRSQTQEFRKQTSVGSNQECSTKSDGIYIDLTGVSFPSNTCFNVYLCINEQIYSISCPFEKPKAGEKEVMCQAKDDIKCMKDNQPLGKTVTSISAMSTAQSSAVENNSAILCADNRDGFYSDLQTGCKSFFVCYRGAKRIYSCPNSLVFNSKTVSCDPSKNVACAPQAACPSNLTKLYPDHDSGCQKYFGCINGTFRYLTCPPRSLFSATTLQCEPADKIACSNTVEALEHDLVEAQSTSLIGRRLLTPLNATATSLDGSSSFNCSGKPDGFYPDHGQNCHVFYRCVHGKKFSHYCTSGQLFSSRLQGCDLQENVTCDEQTFVRLKPDK